MQAWEPGDLFCTAFHTSFQTLSLVPCSDCKQLDTPDERRFDAITCLVKELLQVRLPHQAQCWGRFLGSTWCIVFVELPAS
jgi:hypothetical protein